MTARTMTIDELQAAFYAKMRESCDGDPARLAMVDELEAEEAASAFTFGPQVIPACPSWCGRGDTGHFYENAVDDAGTWSRFHEWSVPGGLVDAYMAQEEFNRDGVVTYGPVEIHGEAFDHALSVDEWASMLAEVQALVAKAQEAQPSG